MDLTRLIIIYRLKKRSQERRRRVKRSECLNLFGTRPKEGIYTVLLPQLKEDPVRFQNFFRMTIPAFQKLLLLVEEGIVITHTNLNANRTINTEERLMVVLRYYATGDSYADMQYSFRISPQCISKIVRSLSDTIYNALRDVYMPKPTSEKWKQIAKEYRKYRQIPNCVGSVDGKHVRIQKPSHGGSLYFNYKSFHSLVLMTSVDANYEFTYIDVGAHGSANDNAIFKNSTFGKKLFNNELDLPRAQPLPGGIDNFPFFFIGDAAFTLSSNLLTPYSSRNPTAEVDERDKKDIFNYRLSRARLNVECAFGMLRSKFRIYDKPFLTDLFSKISVDSVRVICATCILHNYVRVEDKPHVNESDVYETFNADRRTRRNLQDFSIKPNRRNQWYDGVAIRERLSEYFLSEIGRVPWQYQRIRLSNFG